ncbi:MAG: tetratricopeptide repeat protein [Saprospiraceae bacterium]|jgi:tetratricopeptide (TPR) repeat protein|nr:tetratricopeptide repeat protein [Saprospiraceae bacterium]
MLKHTALIVLLLQGLSTALPAQSAHAERRAGDRHYEKNAFQEAENAYAEAAGDPVAQYNAGIAAFRQGKYEVAVRWFQTAAASPSEVQADAMFNLGNAYMQSSKYREAVTAYERSLRRAPNRTDAKKNLQIARNKLREKQEPPPPPPPQRPPPPPPPPPNNNYVDQARQPYRKETPTGTVSAAAARQVLEGMVEQEEIKNARRYRALPPEANPGRVKKDW